MIGLLKNKCDPVRVHMFLALLIVRLKYSIESKVIRFNARNFDGDHHIDAECTTPKESI